MRKLFNKFRGMKRLARPSPRARIKTPYQGAGKEKKAGHSRSSHGKSTQSGIKAEHNFSKSNTSQELICPQCQYHLRTEPSISSPCPNCGYVGDGKVQNTQSDRRTMVVSNLDLDNAPGEMSSFHFDLIAENSGSRIRIESEDPELTLNRDHLEPGNNTISADQHLLIKFHEGKVSLSDVSSNGATYIQVTEKVTLLPGIKIVIGNQVYTFRQKSQGEPHRGISTQTSKVGSFEERGNHNEFELFDERSGKLIKLNPGVNKLNRSALDPGNASISSKEHAILEYRDGQWYISDVSSNQATFIQVRSETVIRNGIKLIVGSTVFSFEC